LKLDLELDIEKHILEKHRVYVSIDLMSDFISD